jgi:hypothetical protein
MGLLQPGQGTSFRLPSLIFSISSGPSVASMMHQISDSNISPQFGHFKLIDSADEVAILIPLRQFLESIMLLHLSKSLDR